MRRVSIRRQLGRQYRLFLGCSVLLLPFIGLLVGNLVISMLRGFPSFRQVAEWWSLPLVLSVLVLIGFGYSLWRLLNMDQHRDLVGLRRYGDLSTLLPEIETELADDKQVARIGRMFRSFQLQVSPVAGELGNAEVWLTPSWLIYVTVEGNRMHFFRLDSLILTSRDGEAVLLIDRHNVHLRIPGNDSGVTRLLAEILVRVPWALNRFSPETERTWKENPQQIIAEADRRRQEVQTARPLTGQDSDEYTS